MRLFVVAIALDDPEEIPRRACRVPERAQDLDVHRERLVAQRLGPVVVPILLEEVARVGGLGRLERGQRIVRARGIPEAETGMGLLEEGFDVEGDVRERKLDCTIVGGDEVVSGMSAVGIEHRAQRAEATESRFPVRAGSSSGHRASISSSRTTGRPLRAARILSRSRDFFERQASCAS